MSACRNCTLLSAHIHTHTRRSEKEDGESGSGEEKREGERSPCLRIIRNEKAKNRGPTFPLPLSVWFGTMHAHIHGRWRSRCAPPAARPLHAMPLSALLCSALLSPSVRSLFCSSFPCRARSTTTRTCETWTPAEKRVAVCEAQTSAELLACAWRRHLPHERRRERRVRAAATRLPPSHHTPAAVAAALAAAAVAAEKRDHQLDHQAIIIISSATCTARHWTRNMHMHMWQACRAHTLIHTSGIIQSLADTRLQRVFPLVPLPAPSARFVSTSAAVGSCARSLALSA